MSQGVKVLVIKPKGLRLIPDAARWEERTDSRKLSSESHWLRSWNPEAQKSKANLNFIGV